MYIHIYIYTYIYIEREVDICIGACDKMSSMDVKSMDDDLVACQCVSKTPSKE